MIGGLDNLSQVGTALTHALFDGVWVGAIVAAAVYLMLLGRRLNAATRHAAWYSALLVIAALPIISFGTSLSRIQLSTPAPVTFNVDSGPVAFAAPALGAPNAAPSMGNADPSPIQAFWNSDALRRAMLLLAVGVGIVAAIRITLLAMSLVGLARVKRASALASPALVPSLARAMASDPNAREIDLRVSDTLDAPAAAGFRSPAILLPRGLVDGLERDALDQIAMHEYAHLRRFDDWTNLGQRVLERLYWYNPAVWFVSGRVDLEREIACDDWAVAGRQGVSGYADCLLHLARDGRLPSFAATAPGAFLTRNQVVARIEHLLERHRDGEPAWRPTRLLAVAPVLLSALALVVLRAPAIALHIDSPALAAQAAAAHLHVAVAPQLVEFTVASRDVRVDRPRVEIRTPAAFTLSAPARIAKASAFHYVIVERTVTIQRSDRRTELRRSAPMPVRQPRPAAAVHPVVSVATFAKPAPAAKPASVAVDVSSQSDVMAAASETDNLSSTPNDRNILAHCTGCDLSDQDLRNADLHGLTLTGDDLSGADLRGANLRGTNFTGVDLSDAKLDGSDLRGAVMTGSDIDGTTFSGAKTDGLKLVGMQITNDILAASSARSVLASCSGCDLSGLNLRGRDLHGITLDGADLSGADLSGANLSGAHLNGVNLQDAKFDGTDLTNASLNGCDLQGVDLTNARTTGLQLQGSQVSAAHPTPCPKATIHLG